MPPQILMIDNDSSGARIRGFVLEASGYNVTVTTDPEKARVLLLQEPDAIVCGLSMIDSDRSPFLPRLRQLAPNIPIVAITNTPYVRQPGDVADQFVMKLDGPKALLVALEKVLRPELHPHSHFSGERIVYVDRERRYIDATAKACELVGYRREELLGMRIEDLSVLDSLDVRQQFAEYVGSKSQEGFFKLRHKNGQVISIKFRAVVFSDGCMAAEWEPLADEHSGKSSGKT